MRSFMLRHRQGDPIGLWKTVHPLRPLGAGQPRHLEGIGGPGSGSGIGASGSISSQNTGSDFRLPDWAQRGPFGAARGHTPCSVPNRESLRSCLPMGRRQMVLQRTLGMGLCEGRRYGRLFWPSAHDLQGSYHVKDVANLGAILRDPVYPGAGGYARYQPGFTVQVAPP